MLNNQNYVQLSLELHLFFARIMKEHSFFLEAGFQGKDQNYKDIAHDFQMNFAGLLNQVTDLSNRNVSKSALDSQEFITNQTLAAEKKTSELSGIPIDQNLTRKEMNLTSGVTQPSEQLINQVRNINRRALPLIENLITFKNEVLNQVLTCRMYTTNYPLLINHIIQEAKMYYDLLSKIERREILSLQEFYEQELFWNNIMMEHAEFIRGLLDPSEKKLILTADQFAMEYEKMLQTFRNRPLDLKQASIQETMKFQQFNLAAITGILDCKIRSIILPLLADHVLREANHFIRILNQYRSY